MKKRVAWIIGVALACVTTAGIAFFIWPTPYSYDSISFGPSVKYPVRMNRFTGKTEILYPSGWKPPSGERPSANQHELVALPEQELKKLAGEARVGASSYLHCDIYNGSTYDVKEIVVLVTIRDDTDAVKLRRAYQMVYTLEGDKPLRPLTSGSFGADLGFSLQGDHKFSWRIQDAKGVCSIRIPDVLSEEEFRKLMDYTQ